MTTIPINARGGPCDVAFHGGYLYLTYQSGEGADAFVVVEVYAPTGGEKVQPQRGHVGDGYGVVRAAGWRCSSGAFPRLYAALGSWWLAYRDEQERITLRKDGEVVWQSPTQAGGNDPVCFGRDTDRRPAFAWLTFNTNVVYVAPLTKPSDQTPEGSAFGTGLSHIDGNVVTVDEARGRVPGMTRPAWAGSVVVGEHPDSGVLVRHLDGRERVFWTGYVTYTPRVAVDGLTYALATWNGTYGPMLLTFTGEDLTVSASGWPPGDGWTLRNDIAEIDIVEYLLGSEWSRNGMHVPASVVTYSHPFQARSGLNWVQHTKFDPPDTRGATWTYTDQWVGLAFDGTNELDKGYRIVVPGTDQTAALYPRRMKVGKQHAHTVDVELHYLATNTRRPVTYSGWVEAVYDGPRIGDIPPTTHAVIMFDPAATDTRGWREQNIGARGLGCWYWHRARKADNSVADMRWIGTTNAPRVPDIPVTYTSALPVLPAPEPEPPPKPKPEPEPTPMPTLKNRDQWFAEFSEINDFYAAPEGLQRPGGMVIDGAADIIAMREWGFNLMSGATVADTKARIRQSEEWRAKHPEGEPQEPEPEPRPSRLVGPLRIAADKSAFQDDAGPVLPVLCHAGDLLSRWTRDPAGVRSELDAIADAGYDGVRTWTVLGGSSYWAGREVGPMYQADYWKQLDGFVDALHTRRLRWLVSQGDMMRVLPSQRDREAFMRSLATSLDDDQIIGVDAGNELLWNGETDPSKMRAVVDAFRAVLPCAVWSLTSPGSEEQADLDTFSGSVFDVHGYRDGHAWDKIRHIFSIGYEIKPRTRLGIQSEPFGYGDLVSASANKHELTPGVMALAAAVSLMARQMWVYFSGPGVKSDAGQRLVDMPGFRETCAVRDWLPIDVMTFGTICHGGASQKGRRVYAVPGTDETRADGVIHADGRWVWALYGPRWRECALERDSDITGEFPCGNDGRLVQGRFR